ncbi:MAG TPA: hypothetical protein VGE53_00880 [Candidatus Paceibacterota bacterium]
MSLAMLAIASGLLQALGYFVYVRKSLRHELKPNPTTWFMFAYGTATLTVLEWDRNATWMMLLLPVTCATLSLFVAVQCLMRGSLKWPEHPMDRGAFLTDVLLTMGYVGIWVLTSKNVLTEEDKDLFALAFLVLTNASTVVSFGPLIREAIKDPRCEHPLPWLIWSCAYATLAYVTWQETGWESEFMIYPVLNSALHGLVGVISVRRWFLPAAPLIR